MAEAATGVANTESGKGGPRGPQGTRFSRQLDMWAWGSAEGPRESRWEGRSRPRQQKPVKEADRSGWRCRQRAGRVCGDQCQSEGLNVSVRHHPDHRAARLGRAHRPV